jgi:hypothetical protein
MNAVTAGALIALLVVGYPLYQLVTTGNLDATAAVVRGGIVAAGCALGIAAIVRLALSWEADAEHTRRRTLNSLFSEMENAVADGSLKSEEDTDQEP